MRHVGGRVAGRRDECSRVVPVEVRGIGAAGQELVVAEDPTPPKLAYLFTCRWCAGMWVSFAVLAVRRTRWWPHVADALAYSSAAALLARFED